MDLGLWDFNDAASMTVDQSGTGVVLSILNEQIADLREVVYVWKRNSGDVIRIGRTDRSLLQRLGRDPYGINSALRGVNKKMPEWEREKWLEEARAGGIVCSVYQPSLESTEGKKVKPHHTLERQLMRMYISKHSEKPILNRSTR